MSKLTAQKVGVMVAGSLMLAACKTTGSTAPEQPTITAVPNKPQSNARVEVVVEDKSSTTSANQTSRIEHTIDASKSTVERPTQQKVSNAAYGENWWGSKTSNYSQKSLDLSILSANIDMGVDKARAQGLDGTGVTVAVLDTGITAEGDIDSSRLVAKIGNTPIDGIEHGGEVANLLAGSKNGIASRANVIDATHRLTSNTTNPLISQASEKASIINWSGGSRTKADEKIGLENFELSSAKKHADISIKENDALIIQSAGNEGWDAPGLYARLPQIDPELQKGWIFVTSTNSTKDRALASENGVVWANACGPAKDYCLAAPALYTTPHGGTAVRTRGGTSTSTPRVAAAAALIKQKYPWASNDVLRTTLLTTADDLGNKDLYGWGVLNIGAAINGPKQLPFGELVVDVQPSKERGSVYSFSNDIKGTGSLVKTGSATLNLDGSNSFTGGIDILDGKLNINKLYSGHTNVSGKGTLGGEGVAASVNNKGVVDFTDGLVVGNYYANAGSTTRVGVGPGTNSGKIAGTAHLDGTLQVAVETTPDKTVAEKYSNALEINRRNGEFSEIKAPVMFDAKVDYTNKGIDITLSKKDANQTVSSFTDSISDTATSSIAAGAKVAHVKSENTADFNQVANLYNSIDKKQVLSALYSMSDAVEGNALNNSTLSLERSLTSTQAHLGRIHGESKSGLGVILDYGNEKSTHSPAFDLKSDSNSDKFIAGVSYHNQGLTMGAYTLRQDGGYHEYFNGKAMGQSGIKLTGVGAAAIKDVGDVFVEGSVFYGQAELDNTQYIFDTVNTSEVRSDAKKDVYSGALNVGKTIKEGAALLHGKAGVGFTSVDSSTVPTLRAMGKLERPLETKMPISIDIGVGVEHDLQDRLFSDGAWVLDRTRYSAQAGVTAKLTEAINGNFDVKLTKSGNHEDTSANVGVSVKF